MEEPANNRLWASVLIFILVGVPAALIRVLDISVDPVVASLIYGLGIVAGAFLLSWAAEVAQLDISAACTYQGGTVDQGASDQMNSVELRALQLRRGMEESALSEDERDSGIATPESGELYTGVAVLVVRRARPHAMERLLRTPWLT